MKMARSKFLKKIVAFGLQVDVDDVIGIHFLVKYESTYA